ncbi:MAG: hypothetical protein KGS72_06360 [Cyanobacteria bacterium REEB67]|nr:hypothetical protein [Cyanobacteria bacterium REEB67]
MCAIACITFGAKNSEAQQIVQGRQIFPSTNIWNQRIDSLPVDANSNNYITNLGASVHFHPDWGTNLTYGIRYNIVGDTPSTDHPVFQYADESDAGPYPRMTTSTFIEGNSWSTAANSGDRHVLLVDVKNDILYELYSTTLQGGTVHAGSGAIFPLYSNMLRPDTWTSADAAGLPIFPALVNYPETSSGPIKHALRFTGQRSNGYIWPARHLAGTQTAGYPPFGQRFRLKANFDITSFSATNQRILTALKQYGMFYADLGSNWYVSGAPDVHWDDNDLNNLKSLVGSDFEAVDESSLMTTPDAAGPPARTSPPPLIPYPARPATMPKPKNSWPTAK